MIKVFSFIASMAGEKSGTVRYSDDLAAVLRKTAEAAGEEISYERMTGNQLRVDYCLSCLNCFKKGICPLDSRDDMPILKKKLLESDILFIGSPVYMGEMSGLMKSVLDRLSYWAHRYELAGKPAAIFTTTDASFGQEVADRLADRLEFSGLVPVHMGHAKRGMGLPNLYLASDMQPIYEEAAQKLLQALASPTDFLGESAELKFKGRKRLADRGLKLSGLTGIPTWEEYLVLERRGILQAETYADYLRDASRGKRGE
ncbi:MAG: flavodoxin family protein [Oscillospiraceae bacterium]|nr:flavodoxin family protein [Oscillospiraceae bacterium]